MELIFGAYSEGIFLDSHSSVSSLQRGIIWKAQSV